MLHFATVKNADTRFVQIVEKINKIITDIKISTFFNEIWVPSTLTAALYNQGLNACTCFRSFYTI